MQFCSTLTECNTNLSKLVNAYRNWQRIFVQPRQGFLMASAQEYEFYQVAQCGNLSRHLDQVEWHGVSSQHSAVWSTLSPGYRIMPTNMQQVVSILSWCSSFFCTGHAAIGGIVHYHHSRKVMCWSYGAIPSICAGGRSLWLGDSLGCRYSLFLMDLELELDTWLVHE